MIELDIGKTIRPRIRKGKLEQGAEVEMGCDLDELNSHRFLEKLGETLTVVAMRKRLKELDIDNNKRLSLTEYLICKYDKDPEELVNAPQGDNTELVAEAQALINKVNQELMELQAKLLAQEEAVQAANDAKNAAEIALQEASAAKQRAEDAVVAAKSAEDQAKSILFIKVYLCYLLVLLFVGVY